MFTRIVVPRGLKKESRYFRNSTSIWLDTKNVMMDFGGIPVWRTKWTGVEQNMVIDELKTKDKFILYLTVELMHTNKTIKSYLLYQGKNLNATIVPTKIDYKNRRFELMSEYKVTDSLEID